MDRRTPHPNRHPLVLALLLALMALVGSVLLVDGGRARAQEATPTAVEEEAAAATEPVTPTVRAPITATVTPEEEPPAVVPVTVTVVVTVTAVATPTPTPTLGPPVVSLPDDEVLSGTIIANRTPFQTMFFLEGALYELPPFRATGLQLARPLTAITLYNCEESNTDPDNCFWDPYPVRKDGFYEIRNAAEEGLPVALILVEAAAPPLEQAWIQNRTGRMEPILFGESLVTLANTEVLEVPVDALGVDTVHVRRCLETAQQRVCEWPAIPIEGGVYYALRSTSTPADAPGATLVNVSLEPVLLQAALMTPTPTPTPTPQGVFCQSQVPSLNVRSGPGLEYLVIGKVRLTDAHGGRVFVIGRNETDEWLAVDPQVVDGGWVINLPNFIICEGETASLPVAPVTDGRLAPPTPTPGPAAPSQEEPTATPTPAEPAGIPPGRAMLIVHNAFESDIRFTLDALTHGLPEGSPSEYDLKPGESISFLIYAGRVQFSASTAFRGGQGGNAEFRIEEGETRDIYVYFVPTDNPSRWNLRYD
ncbi:MAG: SH3 domain-containing protein [Caldilineae bacterium]|nr:MAG: SH3 domain-containing protein [Caldilineae bacterium]